MQLLHQVQCLVQLQLLQGTPFTVPADSLPHHVCYIVITILALIFLFTVGIMHALFAVSQGTQQTS